MRIILLCLILLLSCLEANAGKVYPSSDLTYDGAFLVPNSPKDLDSATFGGMGYDPVHPGLMMVGDAGLNPTPAAIISIPAPVITTNYDSMNRASYIVSSTDPTGGRQIQGATGIELADLEYVNSQLYWHMDYDYDTGTTNYDTIGQADITDLTYTGGAWSLSGEDDRWYDRYLLTIPTSWANTNVNSQYLGLGRSRTRGSYGPSLYTAAPWSDGSPPSEGAALTTFTKLIDYIDDEHAIEWWDEAAVVHDAIWVTVGTKSSFVVYATVSLRYTNSGTKWWTWTDPVAYKLKCNDNTTYMADIVDYGPSASNGNEAIPYMNLLMFFDADEIAEIAAGTRDSWNIQPYAYYNVGYNFIRSWEKYEAYRRIDGGGLAYDSTNQKIYVSEKSGEYYPVVSALPVIHVYSLSDTGSSLDTTAPSDPVPEESNGTLTWTANSGETAIIYKQYTDVCNSGTTEFHPISASDDGNWIDPEYTVGDVYAVQIYDEAMNSSSIIQIGEVGGTIKKSSFLLSGGTVK